MYIFVKITNLNLSNCIINQYLRYLVYVLCYLITYKFSKNEVFSKFCLYRIRHFVFNLLPKVYVSVINIL